MSKKPKIFISYSWDSEEHKNQVREYADNLQSDEDLEIILDSYLNSTPTGGLKKWMKNQVRNSDLIIIICTERYLSLFEGNVEPTEGRGVKWESIFISNDIYNNKKDISVFFPVIFTSKNNQYIPDEFLTDCISYNLSNNELEKLKIALKDKWKEISESSIQPILKELDLSTSDETVKIKSYFNSVADKQKLFITIARQFFPVNYYKSMPKEVNDLIDELLKIGQRINSTCIPILCILNEICDQEYSPDIVDYIEYLKNNKFANYDTCGCRKNIFDTTIIFQILFNYVEDGTYSIEAWKYENETSEKISKWVDLDTQKVDLNDANEIKELVEKLEENIDSIYYDDIPYVELILPVEILHDNEIYKGWKELFASYYCLFRINSRFTKYNNKLINQWRKLKIDQNSDNILNSSDERLRIYKYIEDRTYKNNLTAQSLSVLLEKKIDNFDLLFEHIKKYGIPIALSSLSGSKTTSEIIGKEISEITLKECKIEICKHIMDNSGDDESNILFVMDNPETTPEVNKNPEQYQYG